MHYFFYKMQIKVRNDIGNHSAIQFSYNLGFRLKSLAIGFSLRSTPSTDPRTFFNKKVCFYAKIVREFG